MKKWTTAQMIECLEFAAPAGSISRQTAAELRRLHEVNQKLLRALEQIRWSNDSKWQVDCACDAIDSIAKAKEQMR